jgi:tetratricopeptide (TPR) repeat protein
MKKLRLLRTRGFTSMVSAAAFAVVLSWSPRAAAAEVRDPVKEARMACLLGDYAKGVAILAELFVESRDPTYLFNQARCYQQNGRNQEAIDRFREYLRIATNLKEEDAALTKKHIGDCQALLTQQASAQPGASTANTRPAAEQAASPSPQAAGVPVPQTPPVPAPTQSEAVEARSTQATLPGAGMRTAGVVAFVLGAVALGAGVGLNLKVNSMASDLEVSGAYSRSTESKRADYATLAWIGYGAGAAFVASGAVLYYLGWNAGRTGGGASVACLPAVTPNGIGGVLQGSF